MEALESTANELKNIGKKNTLSYFPYRFYYIYFTPCSYSKKFITSWAAFKIICQNIKMLLGE